MEAYRQATDHALIETLYASVGDPAGWQPFVDSFVRTYAGGKGGFVLHDLAARHGGVETSSGFSAEELQNYDAHFASVNPWLANAWRLQTGVASSADVMCPRPDLKRTEFYNDFLKPMGVGAGAGVIIQQNESRFMLLTTLFPEQTAARDPDIVGRLQRFAPHVLRVAQINRQLALLETCAALGRAPRGRGAAMLVVAPDGALLHANDIAERLLAAGDGLRLAAGRLEAAQPAPTAALQRLIGEAAGALHDVAAPPGGTMRLPRAGGRKALEVLVAPAPHRLPRGTLGAPMAVLFIKEAAQTMNKDELWRRLYRLTAAEARLMTALVTEDTLESAAEKFHVSRETLRTQLKIIFQKTGARTQVELVRLGLRETSLDAGEDIL